MRVHFKLLDRIHKKFGDFDVHPASEERTDLFFDYRETFFVLRFSYYMQLPNVYELTDLLPNGYSVKETEYECDERGSLYEYEVRWM